MADISPTWAQPARPTPQPAAAATATPQQGAQAAKPNVRSVVNAAAGVKKVTERMKAVSINFNEADSSDPSKPKSGTLKGVQAAEVVYRRRLQQQYVLNPYVWFLRIMIQQRTEDVNVLGTTKKLIFQEESADIYFSFHVFEESEARELLTLGEFDEGHGRVEIRTEEAWWFRHLTYGFIDRLQVVTSERDLRTHIASRCLETLREVQSAAYRVFGQQRVVDEMESLFRREHAHFLARLETTEAEGLARLRLCAEEVAVITAKVDDATNLLRCNEEEKAARLVIADDFMVNFIDGLLPREYERSVFMDQGEYAARQRMEREAFQFLAEAFDSLQALLDLFYEERAEAQRRAEEAERRRLAAEAEALRLMLEEQRSSRRALEGDETVGRRNPEPPVATRVKIERQQPERREGGDDSHGHDDDEPPEYETILTGPSLGIEVDEAMEWVALMERFDAERWTVEESVASAAQHRQRLLDVAVQRVNRLVTDEADARRKLYETIDRTLKGHDQMMILVAELSEDEEQQRATFEWAELESRAAVAKLMAKGNRGGKGARPTAAIDTPAVKLAAALTGPRDRVLHQRNNSSRQRCSRPSRRAPTSCTSPPPPPARHPSPPGPCGRTRHRRTTRCLAAWCTARAIQSP
jgi:hypothetical protein